MENLLPLFMFFFVLPAMFAVVGLFVFLYLRMLFRLVVHLEMAQPDVWRELGSPREGTTRMPAPGKYGTMYVITPFMPLALWLMSSEYKQLDQETQALVGRVRLLFGVSFVGFVVLFASMIGTIVMVELSGG